MSDHRRPNLLQHLWKNPFIDKNDTNRNDLDTYCFFFFFPSWQNHHYGFIGRGYLEHPAVKDSEAFSGLSEKKHF